jgi:ubiquinol-cytochrome c reductase cytochrome c1 subunit
MIMIKKLLGALALSLTCAVAFAEGSAYPLDHAPDRLNDMAALQTGAKLFVNYCLNCHSANMMRYNKLKDLGLTDDEIKKNLLFTGDKVGDLMHVAMQPADSKKWFGTSPPDLSVIARAKGTDYIYTYLRSFYRDTAQASGWNNLVFPKVAMPNVLWQLQGPRAMHRVTIEQTEDAKGAEQWQRTTSDYDSQGFSTIKSETLKDYDRGPVDNVTYSGVSPAQRAAFDNDVADISNFLQWMSEPGQQFRKELGVWVMLFLMLFFVVAWQLNKAFWKDVK